MLNFFAFSPVLTTHGTAFRFQQLFPNIIPMQYNATVDFELVFDILTTLNTQIVHTPIWFQ